MFYPRQDKKLDNVLSKTRKETWQRQEKTIQVTWQRRDKTRQETWQRHFVAKGNS